MGYIAAVLCELKCAKPRLAILVLLAAIFTPHLAGQSSLNSATLVKICAIQGIGQVSPYQWKTVVTRGVVFADFDQTSRRGFFIQDENCDGNPATSDGIFVYTGIRTDVVQAGDLVEVTGKVQEYYGMTEISATVENVLVLSRGHPLPAPTDLDPPFDENAAADYLESLEGMYVRLDHARVVGSTNAFEETWVVRSDLGIARVFQGDPRGAGVILRLDDGGLYTVNPQARVGDSITQLVGFIEYTYNAYRFQLLAQPTLTPGVAPDPKPVGHGGDLTIAGFNLRNLFDSHDDPNKEDAVLSPAEYQRRLNKLALAIHDGLGEPDIIGVQEAENQEVLHDLVAQPEIVSSYGVVWVEGPDRRGIDVALLYRLDRIRVIDFSQHQGCTRLVDGLGPDGNRNVLNPQNALTCDTDGNGSLDGNRLFSRPPLLVRFELVDGIDPDDQTSSPEDYFVIVNHWKSKIEDTNEIQYTTPRRIEQARFVADLAKGIMVAFPHSGLIVLGDLNDYPDSQPLSILRDAGLWMLSPYGSHAQTYTFIHQGVSQVLDYLLVGPSLHRFLVMPVAIHINADYPVVYSSQSGTFYRSSDHDPVLARFFLADHAVFIPLVASRR